MTKLLRFDDEALEEMDAAASWYEARREGLGIEFMGEVRQALLAISEMPRTWPLVPHVPEQLGVHRFLLRRFPYAVIYLELPTDDPDPRDSTHEPRTRVLARSAVTGLYMPPCRACWRAGYALMSAVRR